MVRQVKVVSVVARAGEVLGLESALMASSASVLSDLDQLALSGLELEVDVVFVGALDGAVDQLEVHVHLHGVLLGVVRVEVVSSEHVVLHVVTNSDILSVVGSVVPLRGLPDLLLSVFHALLELRDNLRHSVEALAGLLEHDDVLLSWLHLDSELRPAVGVH